MRYLGDITPNKSISFFFNTQGTGASPIILTGNPAPSLRVYKNNSTTPTFTGVSLAVNFNSIVGLHNVVIDTSANTSFYNTGSNFSVMIATGTVDTISVVGKEVGSFSISNRSSLRPLIADRTLDVDSAGNASANITSTGQSSIADAFLDRDMSVGTDSGSSTVRTVRQALRFLRNYWVVNTGALTVYKEDDATSSWTAALTTTTGGNPIIGMNPAGP